MYRIRVRVPASMQTTVEEMLLGIADATRVRIDRDEVEVFGYSYRRPDASKFAAALTGTGIHTAACQLETVPDDDWVSQGLANLPCVRAGRFVLRGSHLPAPPTVRHDICIDAGPAFGTGHHPTTAMVIETLAGLALRRFRPHRALDVGTGAGVLAIVMARLWRCPVLAVDHDPDAVAYARENVVRNRVTRWVDVIEADGCNATGDVFDVIAANLFAAPLRVMAPQLARSLSTGGYAALSGLLVRQRLPVLHAYANQSLAVRRVVRRQDWLTLLLTRSRARR
ncbi:MAG: 50S ribosomal protein L11 methyltransferase [Rhodospirillales bacterium]|nr:50S ribosomal protein L11 methyltransferase [Rhodospirillales bacterium]